MKIYFVSYFRTKFNNITTTTLIRKYHHYIRLYKNANNINSKNIQKKAVFINKNTKLVMLK